MPHWPPCANEESRGPTGHSFVQKLSMPMLVGTFEHEFDLSLLCLAFGLMTSDNGRHPGVHFEARGVCHSNMVGCPSECPCHLHVIALPHSEAQCGCSWRATVVTVVGLRYVPHCVNAWLLLRFERPVPTIVSFELGSNRLDHRRPHRHLH